MELFILGHWTILTPSSQFMCADGKMQIYLLVQCLKLMGFIMHAEETVHCQCGKRNNFKSRVQIRYQKLNQNIKRYQLKEIH